MSIHPNEVKTMSKELSDSEIDEIEEDREIERRIELEEERIEEEDEQEEAADESDDGDDLALEGLSDAERAALADDEGDQSADDQPAPEQAAQSEQDLEESSSAGDEDPPSDQDDDAPAREEEPAESAAASERYAEGTLAEADEAIKAVKSERATLRAQYNDGQLDQDEYDEKTDELEEKMLTARDHRQLVVITEHNELVAEQTKAKAWQRDTGVFMSESPEFATEDAAGVKARKELMKEINYLNAEPEFQGSSNLELMRAARERASLVLKLANAAAPAPAPKPKESVNSAVNKRAGDRPKVPGSIGDAPLAESAEDETGPTAGIMELEGDAFINAVARARTKMSEEEFTHWMHN